MRPQNKRARLALAAAATAVFLASCATFGAATVFAAPPQAAPEWRPVAGGMEYAVFHIASPPREAHALRVDLATPGLEIVVTPGDGRPSGTTGRTTSAFAKEFGCVAAINANPFSPVSAIRGEPRTIVGLSVSNGSMVSAPRAGYGALLFFDDGRAEIAGQGTIESLAGVRNAVGGFGIVLERGAVIGGEGKREPRSAAGLSADGRTLYLLVIDGRRAGSVGASLAETGAWLAALGAVEGLNLDGGGSTEMVVRDAAGLLHIVNTPIHAGLPHTERVVGNDLGFSLAGD